MKNMLEKGWLEYYGVIQKMIQGRKHLKNLIRIKNEGSVVGKALCLPEILLDRNIMPVMNLWHIVKTEV